MLSSCTEKTQEPFHSVTFVGSISWHSDTWPPKRQNGNFPQVFPPFQTPSSPSVTSLSLLLAQNGQTLAPRACGAELQNRQGVRAATSR